jgi:hypothetical protein
MTLDQLRKFAESGEQHLTKLVITKEGAKALIREHDLEVNANADLFLFEIPVARDTPAYSAMRQAGIDRMKAADERGGA